MTLLLLLAALGINKRVIAHKARAAQVRGFCEDLAEPVKQGDIFWR